MWPKTAPGSTASIPCPCTDHDAEGQLAARVTHQCVETYSEGAQWGVVDDRQCRDRLSGVLCELFMVYLYLINLVLLFWLTIASIAEQINVSL